MKGEFSGVKYEQVYVTHNHRRYTVRGYPDITTDSCPYVTVCVSEHGYTPPNGRPQARFSHERRVKFGPTLLHVRDKARKTLLGWAAL